MEVWKDIQGYEKRYSVSNLGNVKTFNHYGSGKTAILKPAIDKKGYKRVALFKNGKLETKKVHRLVSLAFIENPQNKNQVNHKDGNKKNNIIENLEWCTNKENVKHAIENKLFYFNTNVQSVNKTLKKGMLNGQSILNDVQVLEIRNKFKARIYTRKMLANEYQISEATIKDIILRKSWRHI